jgi:hypothetical protein
MVTYALADTRRSSRRIVGKTEEWRYRYRHRWRDTCSATGDATIELWQLRHTALMNLHI